MTPDLSSTSAVYSNTGSLIHLHVEGFRTSKPRSNHRDFPTTVCGAAAHTWWPGLPPNFPGKATGRVWVPLLDAIKLERNPDPAMVDPRHPSPSTRRWCPKCVGLALAAAGLGDQALDLLAGAIS